VTEAVVELDIAVGLQHRQRVVGGQTCLGPHDSLRGPAAAVERAIAGRSLGDRQLTRRPVDEDEQFIE
jgi:hypothetical protein